MDTIITRSAIADDLETFYRFEQGIIATERPFDATLKDGHIHYYDLKAMITAPDVELAVALDSDKVVGSGYARITGSKVYLVSGSTVVGGTITTVGTGQIISNPGDTNTLQAVSNTGWCYARRCLLVGRRDALVIAVGFLFARRSRWRVFDNAGPYPALHGAVLNFGPFVGNGDEGNHIAFRQLLDRRR